LFPLCFNAAQHSVACWRILSVGCFCSFSDRVGVDLFPRCFPLRRVALKYRKPYPSLIVTGRFPDAQIVLAYFVHIVPRGVFYVFSFAFALHALLPSLRGDFFMISCPCTVLGLHGRTGPSLPLSVFFLCKLSGGRFLFSSCDCCVSVLCRHPIVASASCFVCPGLTAHQRVACAGIPGVLVSTFLTPFFLLILATGLARLDFSLPLFSTFTSFPLSCHRNFYRYTACLVSNSADRLICHP